MESIRLTEIFPTSPTVIFKAWLDSRMHTKMTGGEAVCSNKVGDHFSAWDGYITGQNLEIIPHSKIVQRWRTTEFADEDEDSLLTIELNEEGNTTVLSLIHTHIPAGQTQYHQGWIDHYFVPMKTYFKEVRS